VFPGRLSVSRTFGDTEAKNSNTGGNPKVVIALPDVLAFEITNEYDFIVLGCDGIFDKMNNLDCIKQVWRSI
jgi:protein phosphatase 2C family protein 2/3